MSLRSDVYPCDGMYVAMWYVCLVRSVVMVSALCLVFAQVFVLFFVSPGTCSIALVALLLGVPVYWVHNAYNNNQHNARTSHASDNGYASGQTPLLLTTTISLEDADKDT